MIDAKDVKTHTLYSRFARLQKLVEDDIKNYGKYLDETKPTYLPKYIETIKAAISNENDPVKRSELEDKLTLQEKNYAEYKPKYEDAVAKLPSYINEQKQLMSSKDQFFAPKEKRDEYLYVLDEETCTHLCKETDPTACQCTLVGPKIIELRDNQTDALRIWNNNVHVKGISIVDNRSYDIAHRDAIQLIPPKKVDPARKVKIPGQPSQAWLISDQMSGAILEDVTVEGCTVNSPNGPLQGIFSSDGFFTNLKVLGNDIKTAGSHTIVFNGMLSGEISGNTLRQVGNKKPAIHLYPARFGGNQAEEGMAYILNFADETSAFPELEKHPKLAYEDIVDHGNEVVGTNGTEPIKIINQRDDVSEDYRWMSFGLTHFRYHAFQKEFSTLTFGEYKTSPKYREDFQRLKFWLNEKVQEFTTGERVDTGLPPLKPGDEKLRLIGSILKKAVDNAINSNALDGFSLSNFPETPVRTFTMKQVALKYGDLKPLVSLNPMGKNSSKVLEQRRRTTLKHLLTEAQLTDIKPNPNPVEQTSDTGELPPAVKPDPTDTWSNSTDQPLREALRVLPSLSVPRGQEIHLSFDKTSPYNDDGYTYRWSVPGSDIPPGTNNTYTIKTNNLIIDHRYRLFCDVTKAGKMQRVIAFFEATEETTSIPSDLPEANPAVKPDGADTWSNSADTDLENALRVSPSLSVPLGDKITLSLIAPYSDDTNYTYRWTVFGTSIPVGTENTFVIDTANLNVKNDQRVFCDVTKDGKMQRVIAFFDVTEKTASASETSTAPEVAQAVQPDGADTWSKAADADLEGALRVSPSLSVPQGTDITLSLDKTSPYNGTGYSYRWTVFGTNIPVGTDNTFVIQTTGLKIQDNHRIFCDVTKDGKMQRVIAFFDVKEKSIDANESTSEASTEQGIKPDPAETWSKQEDAALEAAFRVSPSLNVKKGDDINLSLEAPYNTADYSYRWLVVGTTLPQGLGGTYTIKTGDLAENQRYRLFCDVTKDGNMQRVIAFFELENKEKKGTINTIIMDTELSLPALGVDYIIEFLDGTSVTGTTGLDGGINLNNVPVGEFTLSFIDKKILITSDN